MPSAGGGAAAAGGGGDDPTTADEAATFSYTTRTGLNLVLHQSRRSFNCGTTLWSAGEVLARYLEQEKALFKNRGQMRVLELGAGLGLAGIVAALQGPREVVLTDLESVVPFLEKNTRFVPTTAPDGGGETRLWVTAFPWGEDPAAHALAPPYDMVLAADCIYDVKQVAIFLQSLRDVCGPKTTVLVGNEERDASLQKHFVEELTKHFTVKPVKRKKLCELAGYHDLIQVWVCKLRRPKKGGGQQDGNEGDGEKEDAGDAGEQEQEQEEQN